MIINSKIKHKFKTMLGVIRNLALDFILSYLNLSDFIIVLSLLLDPWKSVHTTSARGTTQNLLHSTWESK